MTPTVLLTGATGYIASHTWLALLEAGYAVVGVDNFSNSSPEVLKRLHELSGHEPVFERANVCDVAAMEDILGRRRVDAAVHFAAYKAVGESVAKPLAYYTNNLGGLLTVCAALQRHGVRRFVFSSSATVYGDPARLLALCGLDAAGIERSITRPNMLATKCFAIDTSLLKSSLLSMR